MRATIFPQTIILTKARRAAVSVMAKGCIVARVLPLRCFLFLLPNYTIYTDSKNIYVLRIECSGLGMRWNTYCNAF